MYDILVNLAVNFIKDHYEEIDKKYLEDTDTKKGLISQIKYDEYMLSWIITEIMVFGCKINYLKQYEVDYEDDLILKVKDRYFKYIPSVIENGKYFEEVFPKTKTVIYFE